MRPKRKKRRRLSEAQKVAWMESLMEVLEVHLAGANGCPVAWHGHIDDYGQAASVVLSGGTTEVVGGAEDGARFSESYTANLLGLWAAINPGVTPAQALADDAEAGLLRFCCESECQDGYGLPHATVYGTWKGVPVEVQLCALGDDEWPPDYREDPEGNLLESEQAEE